MLNTYYKNKQVDLVLLDVHLKNGNGLDLLKEIRNSQQAIEVIFDHSSQ